jgi:DDE superfamily endonuclease
MDESRIIIDIEQKSRIILSAEKKDVFAKQDGNREWGTMIECIRVISGDIPPFFIYKGKYIFRDLAKLISHSRVTLACSENGWSNNEIGFEWLKYFNKYTILTGAYRLLILDGYGSYAIFIFTNYARENKIVLLYLSPHTTHRL